MRYIGIKPTIAERELFVPPFVAAQAPMVTRFPTCALSHLCWLANLLRWSLPNSELDDDHDRGRGDGLRKARVLSGHRGGCPGYPVSRVGKRDSANP